MGLLKGLALLPLAPVAGVVWVAEQLEAQAERQLYGPEAVRAQLQELQDALDDGLLSEEEYLRAEDELLSRLERWEEEAP